MTDNSLVFLPLGGAGEIGMNMNLYGFGPAHARKWIMIDCGVTFGDLTTPGVDLIMPDPGYILEDKENLLGLILTHGHEDHIGAVALLGPKLECPVYATRFTANLVENKLAERGVKIDLRVLDMGAKIKLGPFDMEFVTLTHSIPEPNGVIINTPTGTILHTGDWKLDLEPTLGPVADSVRLKKLGDDGVLAMICDSTNVLSAGSSGSEMRVKENLIELIKRQTGRVAVATFASNVSRVVSICEAARAADRSVCLLGRSMYRIVDAARETGLLPDDMTFVEPKDAGYLPAENTLYLCTGSQGEPRAALSRIARGDHADLSLGAGDTVIFSSKIIPGNERGIYDLQNDLVELGVKIITEKDEFIHVSGHPNRDELARMYEWVRPKFAIPVHGEARHLEAHAEFALSQSGVARSLAPRNGDLVEISGNGLTVIDEVPSGRMVLDGDLLMADGSPPMKQRRKLGWAGIVVVSIVLDERAKLADDPLVSITGGPDITAHGDDLCETAVDAIEDMISDLPRKRRDDDNDVELAVKRAVRGVTSTLWGKRPIVEVHVHRV